MVKVVYNHSFADNAVEYEHSIQATCPEHWNQTLPAWTPSNVDRDWMDIESISDDPQTFIKEWAEDFQGALQAFPEPDIIRKTRRRGKWGYLCRDALGDQFWINETCLSLSSKRQQQIKIAHDILPAQKKRRTKKRRDGLDMCFK